MEVDRFYNPEPDPPCVECSNQDLCDRERWACWQFAAYCKEGKYAIQWWRRYPNMPNREIYDHIFPTEIVKFPL